MPILREAPLVSISWLLIGQYKPLPPSHWSQRDPQSRLPILDSLIQSNQIRSWILCIWNIPARDAQTSNYSSPPLFCSNISHYTGEGTTVTKLNIFPSICDGVKLFSPLVLKHCSGFQRNCYHCRGETIEEGLDWTFHVYFHIFPVCSWEQFESV